MSAHKLRLETKVNALEKPLCVFCGGEQDSDGCWVRLQVMRRNAIKMLSGCSKAINIFGYESAKKSRVNRPYSNVPIFCDSCGDGSMICVGQYSLAAHYCCAQSSSNVTAPLRESITAFTEEVRKYVADPSYLEAGKKRLDEVADGLSRRLGATSLATTRIKSIAEECFSVEDIITLLA